MDSIDWLEEDDYLDCDMKSLEQKHVVDGFREGLSKGQDYILQSAFNDGFKKSALCLEKLAKYRGTISALYMYLVNTPQFNEEIGAQFESLILQLEEFENDPNHLSKFRMEEQSSSEENVQTHVKENFRGNPDVNILTESFGKLEQCSDKQSDEPCCMSKEDMPNGCCTTNDNVQNSDDILRNNSIEQVKDYDFDDGSKASCEHLDKLITNFLTKTMILFDETINAKVIACLDLLKI